MKVGLGSVGELCERKVKGMKERWRRGSAAEKFF